MSNLVESGTPVRMQNTSGVVSLRPCNLIGVLVNSTTGGTITLYDEVSATGTPVVNALSTTASAFRELPISFAKGIYLTKGGTLDCTFFVAT